MSKEENVTIHFKQNIWLFCYWRSEQQRLSKRFCEKWRMSRKNWKYSFAFWRKCLVDKPFWLYYKNWFVWKSERIQMRVKPPFLMIHLKHEGLSEPPPCWDLLFFSPNLISSAIFAFFSRHLFPPATFICGFCHIYCYIRLRRHIL